MDIAIVLDLSSSMQELMGGRAGAATRLETTKKALIDFIGRRPDDRIGLIVFSDYPYVVSPLTFDHQYLRDYVGMIDDKTLAEEGLTAIGDGISTGSALLARMKLERGSGRQVMVVFTDGEHNFGEDPLVTLAKADEAGTRVHMVGIDLTEVAKTRPAVVQLANAVRGYGGRYYDATSAAQLQSASTSIDSLEKGSLVQTRYVRNRPVFHYFAIPAVVLLCLVFALRAVPYFVDVT